jgi:hypothetical protein
LGVLLRAASPGAFAGENRAKVISFSIDTYDAISRGDMMESGGEVCVLLRPGAIAALVTMSTPTDARSQDGLVRGLIEEDCNAVFVDVNGLFDYGPKSYRITEGALRETIREHFKCIVPFLG